MYGIVLGQKRVEIQNLSVTRFEQLSQPAYDGSYVRQPARLRGRIQKGLIVVQIEHHTLTAISTSHQGRSRLHEIQYCPAPGTKQAGVGPGGLSVIRGGQRIRP